MTPEEERISDALHRVWMGVWSDEDKALLTTNPMAIEQMFHLIDEGGKAARQMEAQGP